MGRLLGGPTAVRIDAPPAPAAGRLGSGFTPAPQPDVLPSAYPLASVQQPPAAVGSSELVRRLAPPGPRAAPAVPTPTAAAALPAVTAGAGSWPTLGLPGGAAPVAPAAPPPTTAGTAVGQPLYLAAVSSVGPPTGFDVNAYLGAGKWYSGAFSLTYTGSRARVANIEGGAAWMGHETLSGLNWSGVQFAGAGALPGSAAVKDHATAVSHAMVGRGAGSQQRGIAYGLSQTSSTGGFWTGNIAESYLPNGKFSSTYASEYTAYKAAIIDGLVRQPGGAAVPVDVVNSSWGRENDPAGYADGNFSRHIDALLSAKNDGRGGVAVGGVTVVFAAGNNGSVGTNSILSPGSGYNSFVVAALGPYNPGHLPYGVAASFSSRGAQDLFIPTNTAGTTGTYLTGVRARVEIAAPGESLYLADGTTVANAYARAQGTSFAAPTVAGGVALLADYARANYTSGTLTGALDGRVMKAVLMNSAAKTVGWDNGQRLLANGGSTLDHYTTQSLDYATGAGRMDLAAAWQQVAAGTSLGGGVTANATPQGPLGSGIVGPTGWARQNIVNYTLNNYYLNVSVPKYTDLAATLSWFVTRTITNLSSGTTAEGSYTDLNLAVYRSASLLGGYTRTAGYSYSRYNNAEHLSFLAPEDGWYSLEVSAGGAGPLWNLDGTGGSTNYGLAWMARPSTVQTSGTASLFSADTPNLLVAPQFGQSATVNVTGAGNLVSVSKNAFVGRDDRVQSSGVGTLNVSNGATLRVSDTLALGAGSTVTVTNGTLEGGILSNAGGTLAVGGTTSSVGFLRYDLSDGGSLLALAGTTYTTPEGFGGDQMSHIVLSSGAAINLGGAGTFNAAVPITGGGRLRKVGSGQLALDAANTFTGGVEVAAGTLRQARGDGLPAGAGVTVAAGATFDIGGSWYNPSTPAGTVTLNGGRLLTASNGGTYYLNRLVMTDGGTVDLTASAPSGVGLRLGGAFAGVTVGPSSTPAEWAGGSASGIANHTTTPLQLNVMAGGSPSGVDLEAGIRLSTTTDVGWVKTGDGTVRLRVTGSTADLTVQQGRLRVDDPAFLGSGNLTLAGGTLTYGGATAALGKNVLLGSTGFSGVEVKAPADLTLSGTLSGLGGLDKLGFGTLTLAGANTYQGGTTVTAGTLAVAADAALGGTTEPVTVQAAGTLRPTASQSTARTFVLAGGAIDLPAGVTYTLSGAAVYGNGFLAGSGTGRFAVGPGGAAVTGATVFNGTVVGPLAGPLGLTNVTFGGSLSVPAGQSLTATRLNVTASGSLAVAGTAAVSQFTSVGQTSVTGAGVLANTGAAPLVFGGGSVTTVGGYNPATGQATPGGAIDIGGQDLVVQGGFLRNNGTVTGAGRLVVDFGGVAKGSGDYDTGGTVLRNGGVLLAGNSPGLQRNSNLTVTGPAVTGGDLNNATGTVGGFPSAANGNTNNSGWSAFEYGNTANTASGLTLQRGAGGPAQWRFRTTLNDGIGDTPGAPANFSAAQGYTWTIFRPRTAASAANPTPSLPADQLNTVATVTLLDAAGNTLANTDANLNTVLAFDRSQFLDPATGQPILPSAGTFGFAFGPDLIGRPGTVISVVYAPVPEPGLVLAVAAGGLAGLARLRRRGGG